MKGVGVMVVDLLDVNDDYVDATDLLARLRKSQLANEYSDLIDALKEFSLLTEYHRDLYYNTCLVSDKYKLETKQRMDRIKCWLFSQTNSILGSS